jgi:hypothetical protein
MLAAAALGGFYAWRNLNQPAPQPIASVTPKPPVLPAPSLELPGADQVPTRDVALVLLPIDARVFLDDEDLGPMPVTIKVKEGQPVQVKIVREGYWTRKITLDGKKKRVVVGLYRKQGNAPPPETGEQGDPERDDEAAKSERKAPPKPASASRPAPEKIELEETPSAPK